MGDDSSTCCVLQLKSGICFINLKVNISVSEISNQNSVILRQQGASSAFVVPSLTKRSAQATYELRDGQTIGVAGLINENLREVINKFPGLGDLPVLGALFRSQDFIKGESELMILITPRLSRIGLLEFYRASETIAEGRECVKKVINDIERILATER